MAINDIQYSPPHYMQWVINVACWDGLFPAFIFSVSIVFAQLLPNNRPVAETLMVSLPVLGALTRLTIGRRKIESNHCSIWARTLQFGCLAFAVVLFMTFDFFIVHDALIPDRQQLRSPADSVNNLCIAGAYLVLGTCAMYPGRRIIDQGTSTTAEGSYVDGEAHGLSATHGHKPGHSR